MKTRSLINRYDLFSTRVFGFNIEGSQTVGSGLGFCCTLLVVTVTLMFGTLKMRHLIEGHNPNISYSEEHDKFETADDFLDVRNSNFSLAFYVEDFKTK